MQEILAGTTGTVITPRGKYGGPDDLSPRHGGDGPRRRRTDVR